MDIKIKKLRETAKIPRYETEGAACFDITAASEVLWKEKQLNSKYVFMETVIETGLAFEIPEGYRLDIYPRSGNSFKYNLQLANGVGKIDSDYRGEVKLKLIGVVPLEKKQEVKENIIKGSRVAQGEINPVLRVNFMKTEELSKTERDKKGFGSTGR